MQVLPPNLHPTWGYLPDPPSASQDAHQPASSPASLQASPIKAPAGQASPPGRPIGWAAADAPCLRPQDPEQLSPKRSAGTAPHDRGGGAQEAGASQGEPVANGTAGATHCPAEAGGAGVPAESSTEGTAHSSLGHAAAGASPEPDDAAGRGRPASAEVEHPAAPGADAGAAQADQRSTDAAEGPCEEGLRSSGNSSEAGAPDVDAPEQGQALQLDKRSESAALAAAHHEPPPVAPGQPSMRPAGDDSRAAGADGAPALRSAAEGAAAQHGDDTRAAEGRGQPEEAGGPCEVSEAGTGPAGSSGEGAPDQAARGAQQWLLFNDFAVGPTSAEEVTQLYGLQKIPCLVLYTQARAAACRLRPLSKGLTRTSPHCGASSDPCGFPQCSDESLHHVCSRTTC